MHTSSILKSEDFEFWSYSDEGPVQMEFPRLCPGYAETDRVAIVSPVRGRRGQRAPGDSVDGHRIL